MATGNMTMKKPMNIPAKIRESEVYRSMGLPDEALKVCQQILLQGVELDPRTREKIKERILQLRKDISEQEKPGVPQISNNDVHLIKRAIDHHGGIQGVLDKADAYKEMGLFREAIGEYQKLLHMNYPKKEIVAELSGCLLGIFNPHEAIREVLRIISDKGLTSCTK